MRKTNNGRRALGLGLVAASLCGGTVLYASATSPSHSTASVRYAATVADTVAPDTVQKPDTTKPDTTKKPVPVPAKNGN